MNYYPSIKFSLVYGVSTKLFYKLHLSNSDVLEYTERHYTRTILSSYYLSHVFVTLILVWHVRVMSKVYLTFMVLNGIYI